MNTLDFEFRAIGAVLTLVAGCFFYWKYPAANCLLGFTAIGLGAEKFFNLFSYAQISVSLQAIGLILLALEVIRKDKITDLWRLCFEGPPAYFVGLIVVWLKIFWDCWFYGLDDIRFASLKVAVYSVFLPSAILLLSFVARGSYKTFQGLIVGLCVLPCTYLLPVIYPMLVEDRIIGAILGATRLTTYLQDTINGGRMFFFGCLGFLMVGGIARGKDPLKFVNLGFGLIWFILALLNGTRQYVFAIVVAFIALLLVLGRMRQAIAAGVLLSVGLSAYFLRGLYSEAQISERVSSATLLEEIAEGRGRVWKEAWAASQGSPFFGVGFRNFGEESCLFSEDTGEVLVTKDTAHGFFQDVFVEHGMFLGAFLFLSWLWVVRTFLKKRRQERDLTQLLLFILFTTLSVPEWLSAAPFNAVGFHLFGVASIALRPGIKKRYVLGEDRVPPVDRVTSTASLVLKRRSLPAG